MQIVKKLAECEKLCNIYQFCKLSEMWKIAKRAKSATPANLISYDEDYKNPDLS